MILATWWSPLVITVIFHMIMYGKRLDVTLCIELILLKYFIYSNKTHFWSLYLLTVPFLVCNVFTCQTTSSSHIPGPCFNISMLSYKYRKCYCGDKMILRASYLHNNMSYTGKMPSPYWTHPACIPCLAPKSLCSLTLIHPAHIWAVPWLLQPINHQLIYINVIWQPAYWRWPTTSMRTSWHGNTFHNSGPLWGEFGKWL